MNQAVIDRTYFTEIVTKLGLATITSNGQALSGFYFNGQKYFPDLARCGQRNDELALFAQVRSQYHAYENGTQRLFDLPLALAGTPFQQCVWHALLAIPFGQTCSYGALAQAIAKPAAVRAVGAAVGRNPISVIVPCHRVVGTNGSLTGYAGGLPRKQSLLQHEGALT